MKVGPCVPLLALAFIGSAQSTTELRFSGIVINTTHADSPIAAPMELVVDTGKCALTILPPLVGSSACHITAYDEASGKIEITSAGPPAISWSGVIKGNLASGTYVIDVTHQNGLFYLALVKRPPAPPLGPPPETTGVRSSCSPAVESAISGDFEGWDGETLFKLDNGQIWQQAEYDYDYDYEYHPDVTIYQTAAGCRMKVEGDDQTILVKRIK